jgi:hypothetical protein
MTPNSAKTCKQTENMKTRQMYMVKEDGDEDERLSCADYYPHIRDPDPEEVTLEAMAQLMDEAAEDCNAHDFVGVHRGLAAILFQEVGREKAGDIMRRLVNYEGLYGLVGICGGDVENAEQELGVPLQDWSDWALPNS